MTGRSLSVRPALSRETPRSAEPPRRAVLARSGRRSWATGAPRKALVGGRGRVRTYNPQLRRLMLYPVELRGQWVPFSLFHPKLNCRPAQATAPSPRGPPPVRSPSRTLGRGNPARLSPLAGRGFRVQAVARRSAPRVPPHIAASATVSLLTRPAPNGTPGLRSRHGRG